MPNFLKMIGLLFTPLSGHTGSYTHAQFFGSNKRARLTPNTCCHLFTDAGSMLQKHLRPYFVGNKVDNTPSADAGLLPL